MTLLVLPAKLFGFNAMNSKLAWLYSDGLKIVMNSQLTPFSPFMECYEWEIFILKLKFSMMLFLGIFLAITSMTSRA